MQPPLNILLLEDSQFDVELITHELKKLGRPIQLRVIQSEFELRKALEFQSPDLILSDHGLPAFDGFTALRIVRQEQPELPFIFVSGSNNQQMVLDMYDCGATDYVFKRDLVDLCPAITRALGRPTEPSPPADFQKREENKPEPTTEKISTTPPTVARSCWLFFCPQCHRTRDQAGRSVLIEDCLAKYSEVTVRHLMCDDCSRWPEI